MNEDLLKICKGVAKWVAFALWGEYTMSNCHGEYYDSTSESLAENYHVLQYCHLCMCIRKNRRAGACAPSSAVHRSANMKAGQLSLDTRASVVHTHGGVSAFLKKRYRTVPCDSTLSLKWVMVSPKKQKENGNRGERRNDTKNEWRKLIKTKVGCLKR